MVHTIRFEHIIKIKQSRLNENKTYTHHEACSNFKEISILLSTPWAKMYKRDVINKHNLQFDNSMDIGEDHKFNLMYFLALDGHIKTTDRIVYCYKLGGFASAVKYHDNIAQQYLKLAQAYDLIEQITERSLNKIKYGLMSGAVNHYIVCLPRKAAIKKMEDTFSMWKCYKFESKEKWYLHLQTGKVSVAYYSYVFCNFMEIIKKKIVRIIRQKCKLKKCNCPIFSSMDYRGT